MSEMRLHLVSCDLSSHRNRMQSFKMVSRLLILSFDYIRPKDPTISLAMSSILSNLKQRLSKVRPSIEVFHRCFDVSNNTIESTTEEVIANVKDIRPQVMATGVYVWNESYVDHCFQNLFQRLECRPKPLVVLGGPQITYAFKNSLKRLYPFADAFIRGYAEQSFADLLIALNSSKTPVITGVHYSTDFVDKGLMSDIDLKPLPSPLLSGQTQHSGYIRFETKRGCRFSCSFCQHRDSYDNSYGRRGSIDINRIEHEIQWIVGQNIDDISIVDPIFNIPNTDYLKVCNHFMDYGFKGRLNLQIRLEMIDNSFIDICRQLLGKGIQLELECGLQTVIKDEMKVIDRPQSRTGIERKSHLLVQNAIPFEVSLIYGLPKQTVNSFRETIQFVEERVKPNRIRAWPLMLLRGTGMYDMKEKYNIREKLLSPKLQPMDEMRQYNGIPHVISSSTFTEEEWMQMKSIAEELNEQDHFLFKT